MTVLVCSTMNQPRRSPRGQERKRDPERTRERILEAALIEFGEHGFAGARISAIAGRAGVNEQLISYYFDGKEGLYRALQQRWQMTSAAASRPEFRACRCCRYVPATERRAARPSLGSWPGTAWPTRAATRPSKIRISPRWSRTCDAGSVRESWLMTWIRRYVLLMLFAAAFAPTVIPQIARRLTGLPLDSASFQEAYAEQLRRVVERLAD